MLRARDENVAAARVDAGFATAGVHDVSASLDGEGARIGTTRSSEVAAGTRDTVPMVSCAIGVADEAIACCRLARAIPLVALACSADGYTGRFAAR